ncbi:KilA-N domain-containing protein, partial [Belnapia sp. T6]|nr:KilA-N domain-containing protein [Belnapia mucosa]
MGRPAGATGCGVHGAGARPTATAPQANGQRARLPITRRLAPATCPLPHASRWNRPGQAHWTDPEREVRQNIIQDEIIRLDPDGFVATTRGRHGGTWAHWQLALSYARYLSPAFRLWCNAVVRAVLAWHRDPPAADPDPLRRHLAQRFRDLHARLDTLERHAADLMFLQLFAQELVLGNRLEFTGLGRSIIVKAVAA